jgi:DHA1 family solute carrier family 18 vesicular amine transporter 1/2
MFSCSSAAGAASAAVLCGGLSLIAQTYPPEVRGTAIGIGYSGLAFGLVTGPLIGGFLFESFGRKQTFRIAACVVLVIALAQLVLLPIVSIPSSSKRVVDKEKKGSLQQFRKLLQNRDIMGVAGAILAVHAVLGCMKPLLQVILDREFGMGIFHRSLVVSIATVTFFISTPVAGMMSDRMPRSRLVALGLFFAVLSTVFFTLRGLGLWALCISVGLLGSSMGVSGSAGQALLADLVDRHNLGEYSMAFALADMADSIGLIVGPILGLSISQILGPSAGVAFIGVFCLLLLPLVLGIQ